MVRLKYKIDVVRLGSKPKRSDNIVNAMNEALKRIDTPYFMRLDSDVLLSPNSIKPLLHDFKSRPDLGMLCVTHNPANSPEGRHVSTGCTIFRTEDARKIVWQYTDAGCSCVHVSNQLNALGLKSEFHPNLMARHLKFL